MEKAVQNGGKNPPKALLNPVLGRAAIGNPPTRGDALVQMASDIAQSRCTDLSCNSRALCAKPLKCERSSAERRYWQQSARAGAVTIGGQIQGTHAAMTQRKRLEEKPRCKRKASWKRRI